MQNPFGKRAKEDDVTIVESEIISVNRKETRPIIAFVKLAHFGDLPLPAYETIQSAGMDLRAAIGEDEIISMPSGSRVLVPTGLKIALPPNYEAQIRPRSGLALKNGITCLNSPGTIDADYRGEVGIILINHGADTFEIKRGDRIAQMVIAPITQAVWMETDDLDETARGTGGFGSTGVQIMAMDVETYLAGVKTKTGLHYLEIVELLKKEGFTKKGTTATIVKNYLKDKYDIGHGHAMGIWRFLKPSVEE